MKITRFSFVLIAGAALLMASLDAAPRRLSDLGGTNNLTDKMFNGGDISSTRSEEMFGTNKDKINFQEWHGSYSNIGEKRANGVQTRGGTEFGATMMNYDTVERQEARLSLDADERKMASVQNWNRMRDNVMSHKFSGTELNTPEARRFSEMVDEVSLQDINRYQFWKNKTDAGIPVQVAGGTEGPKLSDEQRRVMARIQGEDVEVTDYKEQGAKSMTGDSALRPKDDADSKSFIDSLFDW